MNKRGVEIYEFGQIRIDVGEHRIVYRNGTELTKVGLPDKAFLTLVILLRNSGSLVSKEELMNEVWPDAAVEENNLGKSVYFIRQFLKATTGSDDFIETVPKHGYRFVAKVRKLGNPGTHDIRPKTVGRIAVKARAAPRSPAFDLYIRGKVKAGSENVKDTEDAIKVLEAAVAIDPLFAPAYAQLARAYNTRAFKFSAGTQRKLLHENAEVAIEKALSLDADLAEAHFARGLILWTNTKGFPHKQAIMAYKRSLELDAGSDETHHQLSMVYSHIGLLDKATAEVELALDINPNNTMARFRAAVYLAYQGRFDDAIRAYKSVPRDLSPMLVDRCMAEAYVQTGRLGLAKEIVDRYLSETPDDEGGSFTSVKAILLAKEAKGKAAEFAAGHAAEIGHEFGHFHHTAHNLAAAYATLGEAEKAVEWLEKASDGGFPNYTYFCIDPNLDPLRSNKRFQVLMAVLKSQWQEFQSLAQ